LRYRQPEIEVSAAILHGLTKLRIESATFFLNRHGSRQSLYWDFP